jgi:hypothetical protein
VDGVDSNGPGLPLSAYFCIPLVPSLACINQTRALVTRTDYHAVIAATGEECRDIE